MRVDRRRMTISAAAVAGVGLACALTPVGVLRRDKPLHAYGRVAQAVLTTSGASASGIPLLDDAGTWPCTLRASRATSASWEGRDVQGLALRIPGAGHGGGEADVLLASTGTSPVGRFLLTVRRRVQDGPLTTLLPLATTTGPVLLRLDPQGSDATWSLSWAHGLGDWHPAGLLTLAEPWGEDRPLRFSPVDRPLDGTSFAAWWRALRRPAYLAAHHLTPARATRPGRATAPARATPPEGDSHD